MTHRLRKHAPMSLKQLLWQNRRDNWIKWRAASQWGRLVGWECCLTNEEQHKHGFSFSTTRESGWGRNRAGESLLRSQWMVQFWKSVQNTTKRKVCLWTSFLRPVVVMVYVYNCMGGVSWMPENIWITKARKLAYEEWDRYSLNVPHYYREKQ